MCGKNWTYEEWFQASGFTAYQGDAPFSIKILDKNHFGYIVSVDIKAKTYNIHPTTNDVNVIGGAKAYLAHWLSKDKMYIKSCGF